MQDVAGDPLVGRSRWPMGGAAGLRRHIWGQHDWHRPSFPGALCSPPSAAGPARLPDQLLGWPQGRGGPGAPPTCRPGILCGVERRAGTHQGFWVPVLTACSLPNSSPGPRGTPAPRQREAREVGSGPSCREETPGCRKMPSSPGRLLWSPKTWDAPPVQWVWTSSAQAWA